jgi:hypothetical protein
LFLQNTFEYDALQQLREIKKLDPLNGRINYNIAALELTLWQYNVDAADFNLLLPLINDLPSQGIEKSLVKRLLINYHILRSEDYMRKNDYPSKDQSVAFIHTQYKDLALTDEEIFSLAKYLFFYSEYEWSEEIVEPRVDKIDVSEDIVFYYVNLGFYHPDWFSNPKYQNAILNAVNLNRQRFCKFFKSIYKGGASMQLLEHPELRKYYCESCTLKSEMITGFVVPTVN